MAANVNRPPNAATTVEHFPEGTGAFRPLVVDARLLESVVAHLRDWLPNEGCGLLAGVPDGEIVRAMHFFPGTNIDRSPVRYTMDPREVIEAMKSMRQEAWQLAAIVHSHPRTPPEPSRTDRREWFYPRARLVIVSFAGDEPDIGCWALTDAQPESEFQSVPLRIEGR